MDFFSPRKVTTSTFRCFVSSKRIKAEHPSFLNTLTSFERSFLYAGTSAARSFRPLACAFAALPSSLRPSSIPRLAKSNPPFSLPSPPFSFSFHPLPALLYRRFLLSPCFGLSLPLTSAKKQRSLLLSLPAPRLISCRSRRRNPPPLRPNHPPTGAALR